MEKFRHVFGDSLSREAREMDYGSFAKKFGEEFAGTIRFPDEPNKEVSALGEALKDTLSATVTSVITIGKQLGSAIPEFGKPFTVPAPKPTGDIFKKARERGEQLTAGTGAQPPPGDERNGPATGLGFVQTRFDSLRRFGAGLPMPKMTAARTFTSPAEEMMFKKLAVIRSGLQLQPSRGGSGYRGMGQAGQGPGYHAMGVNAMMAGQSQMAAGLIGRVDKETQKISLLGQIKSGIDKLVERAPKTDRPPSQPLTGAGGSLR
jgi:hypothetical protein